jgi:hypothetical protein
MDKETHPGLLLACMGLDLLQVLCSSTDTPVMSLSIFAACAYLLLCLQGHSLYP